MYIILLFSFFQTSVQAQQLDYAIIDSIHIVGNKKTKDRVIMREIRFTPGQRVPLQQLADLLRDSELLLMNTGLFTHVKISYRSWKAVDNHIQLQIDVTENWYIYPAPLFELADRNFNVWWVDQNRSLDRVKIGMEFAHLNFTGNNDRLKVGFKYGYTRSYSMSYRLPYINKQQTLGLFTYLSFARNREINYLTEDNKQLFYGEEDTFIDQRFKAEMALTFRPELRVFHEFIFSFSQERVSQTISQELNPFFFANQKALQRFFTFAYNFTSEQTDIKFYPLRGHKIEARFEKDGLGFFSDRSGLFVTAGYSKFIPLSDRWNLALRFKGKTSLIRERQSYTARANRALGFSSDFLRGFELYIVDGLDMAYMKSSLRFRLFENKINFGKLMPIKAFKIVPIKLFFSINGDTGYVNDPFVKDTNPLNNRMLYSGGIGLDILVFYDKVFQIQYSFNDLSESGLFLHFDLNF